MRRLVLLLILAIPLFASAQGRSQEPALAIAGRTIRASGFTPDSTVVFFCVGLVPTGYESTVYKWSQAVAGDHSGNAAFDVSAGIPCKSIWVAVSTKDGHYAVAAPPGCPLRIVPASPKPLRRSSNGNVDLFAQQRASVDFLYVHPGLGAWKGFAYDGMKKNDADGTPNGVALLRLSSLDPIGGTAAPPAAFAPGGVLFALDYHLLDIAIIRVDGQTLQEVQ